MVKCKQCDNYISNSSYIYSADLRVCSNLCAINRLNDILSIAKSHLFSIPELNNN